MIKPDIVTAGTGVIGIGIGDSPDGVSCTLNSGTSVSAGIITASIALALSAQSQDIENASFPIKHNTVSVKQALAKSAKRLKSLSITEQGAGVFDLDSFISILTGTPQNSSSSSLSNSTSNTWHAKIYPKIFDFRGGSHSWENNTYFLPFNRQKMYASMPPLKFNVTLSNPVALHSKVISQKQQMSITTNQEIDLDLAKQCIDLHFLYP